MFPYLVSAFEVPLPITLVGTAQTVSNPVGATQTVDVSGVSIVSGDLIVSVSAVFDGTSGNGDISSVTDDGTGSYTQQVDHDSSVFSSGITYFDVWTKPADGTETTVSVTAVSNMPWCHASVLVLRNWTNITAITSTQAISTATLASSSFADDTGLILLGWTVNRLGTADVNVSTAPTAMTNRINTKGTDDNSRFLMVYDMAMNSRGPSITRTLVWDQTDLITVCGGLEIR